MTTPEDRFDHVRIWVRSDPPDSSGIDFDERGDAYTYLWLDTRQRPWILRYWDSSEWVRMDGGGTIPDDFIIESMLSPDLRRKLDLGSEE